MTCDIKTCTACRWGLVYCPQREAFVFRYDPKARVIWKYNSDFDLSKLLLAGEKK